MTAQKIKTWRERIELANVTGSFTDKDRDDSGSWLSCAVGEHIAQQPKLILMDSQWMEPTDKKIYKLGVHFDEAIMIDRILRAFELLDLIEARVMEIELEASA